MGIPDRIILTLYTFLMAVVAVLVVLCSLGVIGQTAITAFFATIPGNRDHHSAGKYPPAYCRYWRDWNDFADDQQCRFR